MSKGKNRQKHSPREARNKRAAGAITASDNKRARFIERMQEKRNPTDAPTAPDAPPNAVNDLAAAIKLQGYDEGLHAGLSIAAQEVERFEVGLTEAKEAGEQAERTINGLRKDLKAKQQEVDQLKQKARSSAESVRAHIIGLLFPSPTQGA